MKNLDWYHSLNQPLLSPPDWVFAPVWSFLYITIFVSFILFVMSESSSSKAIPFTIFVVQILLNLSWTPVFFGFHEIGLALLINFLLLISVIFLVIMFYPFSKLASLILVPYLLWVCFALYLTFAIWRLN